MTVKKIRRQPRHQGIQLPLNPYLFFPCLYAELMPPALHIQNLLVWDPVDLPFRHQCQAPLVLLLRHLFQAENGSLEILLIQGKEKQRVRLQFE